jgi:NAD(P)-dependent dehydrogenase (short-subunit alcohol dehydrogenase family)
MCRQLAGKGFVVLLIARDAAKRENCSEAKVISEEPIGRMGRPEEVANAVLWLCPDASGFVIGSAMVIDGD